MSKDGSRTLVEVILAQTTDKDGKVLYYYALIRDRSEKQRADHLEKDLMEAREGANSIFDTAFEGVALFQNGKLVAANDHYAEIIGYTASELVDMNESQLVAPGPQGMASTKPSSPSGASEAMMIRKEGSTASVEMTSKEIQYKGAPARMVRVMDMSEKAKFKEDREQLLKQLAGVSEELSALKQISAISVNVAQPELAMDSLLRHLTTAVRAESGMILVRDGDKLVPRAVNGSGDRLPKDYSEEIGTNFPGKVVNENKGFFVEDAQADVGISEPLKVSGARSLMGVPIRHGTNVIGVLQAAWNSPHAQSEREMRLMEIAADRCASAIIASKASETSKASEAIGSALSEINSQISSSLNLGMSNFR
jgi:PAS domain S-box-containing protein